jgi:trigger factor
VRQYTAGPVKSTLDPLEGNKVKLSVEVDEAEFDRDIDAAFKKLAREVRLPGFRAGKAPRRILEARIGVAPARQQALQDSIPAYLAKAVREHDVDLIATPEIEITGGEEDGDVQFDATCEVRPEVTVPGYGGLRIELPALEPTDEEVQAVLDTELRRHGTLTPVERPIQKGDFVTLDLAATRDGEPVPGLNTDDWSYEVGNGWVAEDFDDRLIGAKKGDELEFTAVPTGTEDEAEFQVTISEVQTLELPELDDEWVSEHIGEFETVDEWRASARERLEQVKLNQARSQLMDRATAALAELVDDEPPESMVSAELQSRVQNFVQQLQAQGIPVEQWLQATGQDPASFTEGMREQSERAVKVDLALRAVAAAEGMEVADDDLEAEYQRIGIQVNEKTANVRKAYERNDAVADLVAQLRKSKALEWLLHTVEVVDPDGKRMENDVLLGHGLHDHDHGEHDHDGDDHGEHDGHEHQHDDEQGTE